jgi:hypothetical protein
MSEYTECPVCKSTSDRCFSPQGVDRGTARFHNSRATLIASERGLDWREFKQTLWREIELDRLHDKWVTQLETVASEYATALKLLMEKHATFSIWERP